MDVYSLHLLCGNDKLKIKEGEQWQVVRTALEAARIVQASNGQGDCQLGLSLAAGNEEVIRVCLLQGSPVAVYSWATILLEQLGLPDAAHRARLLCQMYSKQ